MHSYFCQRHIRYIKKSDFCCWNFKIQEISLIFKYSETAKYSAKSLKIGYTGNDFLVSDIHLNKKGPSAKIQLLNISNDHLIVTRSYGNHDEWPLSNALWTKLYNCHCKYKPELSENVLMYWCHLNFAMFCATSAVGISWQRINHPNLLERMFFNFMCILEFNWYCITWVFQYQIEMVLTRWF